MADALDALTKKIVNKCKRYGVDNIEFTDYAKQKMDFRNVEADEIVRLLTSGKGAFYAEKQEVPFQGDIEVRYKVVYRVSSRYSMIVVVSFYNKVLKVINVIKTSKGAERLWRKEVLE